MATATATRTSKQQLNRFIKQNNKFARASTFLFISLPLLHDYDVKISNFPFYWGRKQARTKFSSSVFKLECGSQHFQRIGIKTTKFENTLQFLLKVTFSLPSLSSMLKLPIVFPLSQSFLMDRRILFKCMHDATCERVVFRKRIIKSPLKNIQIHMDDASN